MNKFKEWLAAKGIDETQFAAKEAAEMATLHKEYTEYVQGEIQKQMETKISKDDVVKLVADAKEELKALLPADKFKSVEDKVTELVDQMKVVRDNQSGVGANESFEDQLKTELERVLPQLKAMKGNAENKGKEIVLTIKAATDVLTTSITNASGAAPVNYVYGQVTDYAVDVRTTPYITQFLDNGTTNKATIPYMDKEPNEGNMAITAEGELKPLISFTFELAYSTAVKIAGRTKVSEEALDDIPNLMAIIRNELKYEHDVAEQTAIMTAITNAAASWVAGGMATSTDSPSNWDALRAAAYSVKIQSKGNFIPNIAILRSDDAYNMGATKDKNGQYVLPAFVLPDGTRVAGMRVFEVNDGINVGEFIVGDLRKFKRRVYKAFSIRIGQGINFTADTPAVPQSDFESNMYTILGESRQHFYMYTNEKLAFIKATFSAVKTSIEVPEPSNT